jgi:hypothetical protein
VGAAYNEGYLMAHLAGARMINGVIHGAPPCTFRDERLRWSWYRGLYDYTQDMLYAPARLK